MSALLTIIIPTFNRANCLSALLDAIAVDLHELEGSVNVLIGDNASTDETPVITSEFSARWASSKVLRHSENVGPDENFCRCVEAVETPYFWIIGDDDLPRAGAISLLIEMLAANNPDLIYLNSSWSKELPAHDEGGVLKVLAAHRMSRRTFARSVNVWSTFISGSIVKRSLAPTASLRRFKGTLLVQLGWIFSAMRDGQHFIHVTTPCVLARAGNAGGYGALRVFGNNFQRVTREALSQNLEQRQMANEIIRRTSISFLPDLIWGVRQSSLGSFDPNESLQDNLQPQLGSSLTYKVLLLPIGTASPFAAKFALNVAHFAKRLLIASDALRARLVGDMRAI